MGNEDEDRDRDGWIHKVNKYLDRIRLKYLNV